MGTEENYFGFVFFNEKTTGRGGGNSSEGKKRKGEEQLENHLACVKAGEQNLKNPSALSLQSPA